MWELHAITHRLLTEQFTRTRIRRGKYCIEDPTGRRHMKEMLYAVRCWKSNEDMILALAGQFKQLSHEPEKFR